MKQTLNIHWKDWCWSWSSNTLVTWYEDLTHWKRSWSWERLRQEEKGETENEMVRWHHQLNGHEFEQTLEDSEGQGSLVWCKESDITEWLSNNNFKFVNQISPLFSDVSSKNVKILNVIESTSGAFIWFHIHLFDSTFQYQVYFST